VRGVEGKRLHSGQVFENWKDIFFGGAKRSFETGAAELKLCSAFVEMPGEAGAQVMARSKR